MHDFFRDQQLAVDEPVQFSENLFYALAQLGRMQQISAHFLVIAERRAAMDQRVIIAFRQAFGLGGNIGLVEIAQEDRRQTLQIADARAVVIPGRAGGLVGLVQIADVHFVHQPQEGRRVTRNIAALAAGFVVPELVGRDFLVPAIKGFDRDGIVFVADFMDNNFAVLFQLPHNIADVFDAILVGQHRALVDFLLDPGGRHQRVFARQIGVPPFRSVPGETFPVVTVFGSRHNRLLVRDRPDVNPVDQSSSSSSSRKSSQSSRFSSIMSVMTSNRFWSIVSS